MRYKKHVYIFYTRTYFHMSSFRCRRMWNQVSAVKEIFSRTRPPNWEDNLSEFPPTSWPASFHCNEMHYSEGLSSTESLMGPLFFLSF